MKNPKKKRIITNLHYLCSDKSKNKHSHQKAQMVSNPRTAARPPPKAEALLVGATAGPSNSMGAGAGAGEIPVNLRLGVITTTVSFWPSSQCPLAPLMK